MLWGRSRSRFGKLRCAPFNLDTWTGRIFNPPSMNPELPWLTFVLMGVITASTIAGFRERSWVRACIFSPRFILAHKEGYRLLTSAGLHADWRHLALNLFGLYQFGAGVELGAGPATLLGVFAAGVMGGGAFSLWLHRHHEYEALGASGGVCGVIFAHLLLVPGNIGCFLIPILVPGWAFALAYLLASYYGLRKGSDGIGHDAHLGGALAGLWLAAALFPGVVVARPVWFLAISAVGLGLLAALGRQPGDPGTGPRWEWPRPFQRPPPRPPAPWEEERVVDEILEKISRSGLHSLTEAERRRLEKAARPPRTPPRG